MAQVPYNPLFSRIAEIKDILLKRIAIKFSYNEQYFLFL